MATAAKSIKSEELKQVFTQIKRRFSRKSKYVFLDNLKLHHAQHIKAFARSLNLHLIFNASYSSEYNPIERLWAFAKR